ncbi:MAG: HAD family hydrolase [Velocimicrobium sp.]
MNKKLIFFDIDGTILGEKSRKILPSTVAAIKKVRENGHYALINTGRTSYLIGKELSEEIGFDGYLLGCGTSILFHGEELMHQSIAKEVTDELMRELRACKIDAVLEGEEGDYRDEFENIHTDFFKTLLNETGIIYKKWSDPDMIVDKLFVYTDENSKLSYFKNKFSHQFDFIDREMGFWEIVPAGFSKASAISYLLEYLGMDVKDTIAIGDSNNDISMLAFAHTSIAMGNATKEVRDMATYITTDVDENGIQNALKWLNIL